MENTKKKFERVSQTDMPRVSLREALDVAKALKDNFAGKNATPINLAKALNRSPSSSSWRFLTGATVAYGLTDNAYNAQSISLTALGEQIVKPQAEGEEKQGLMTALLKPTIVKQFYEKYNGSKFPKDEIAKNVLNGFGVPQDRTGEALKIIIDNAKFVGVLSAVSGSDYVQLNNFHNKAVDNKFKGEDDSTESLEDSQNLNKRDNTVIDSFPFIENQIEIILSKEIQKKAWLSKELTEKVQALMKAAQDLANELEKEGS